MMSRPTKIICYVIGLAAALSTAHSFMGPEKAAVTPAWVVDLESDIKELDATTPGSLGVYVKKFGTDEEMNYLTNRAWYFASTVKVPVAIAVLQMVEEGALTLNHKITLKKTDAVDGSGEVQFKAPGSKLSVAYLIEKMLTQSDSTATDILIRLIGEENLNERIRTKMGVVDFQPFTTILQVRHDAFANLHPKAKNLTNRHFIDLKRHKSSSAKYKAIAKQMGVPAGQLKEKSIEDAFETYYTTGLNSGSLKSFGLLLERLVKGELLSKNHTDLVLGHMTAMTTGERRIKAGLPKNIKFAQKTGTQVSRICNVGVVFTPKESENLIVTACLEKFGNFTEGERTLEKVGQALSKLLKEETLGSTTKKQVRN